eukprot:233017-Prymnesium_polylepis.1
MVRKRPSSDCDSCSRLPLKRPEFGFWVAKSRKSLWTVSSRRPDVSVEEKSVIDSLPESSACSMHLCAAGGVRC